MRGGFTKALRNLLWAADTKAQEMIEAVKVDQETAKVLKSEWHGADSMTGLVALDDGGLQLTTSTHLALDHSPADDADITDLDALTPIHAMFVEWGGTLREDMDIKNVVVKVDPDVSGAGREVVEWVCRLWRVAQVGPLSDRVVLLPITDARFTETGNAIRNITFNFTHGGRGAPVGEPPEVLEPEGDVVAPAVGGLSRPITGFAIFALKGSGEGAANASWRALTAAGPLTGGISPTWTLTHENLIADEGGASSNLGGGGAYRLTTQSADKPWIQVNRPTFAAKTATYSTNPVVLAATPTGSVEIVAEGEEPSDSSFLWEIRDTGGGTWYTVDDGDLVGVDNRYTDRFGNTVGNDLSAVPLQTSYDLRVTLTPSTSLLQSPIARRFGVRELSISDLSGAATVDSVSWGVDPITLKPEIAEMKLSILKTGERDFRDYFSDLFTSHFVGELQIRLWIGHPDPAVLPRKDWLAIDTFDVDDYVPGEARGEVLCISVLERLRVPIPPFVATSGGDGTRIPTEYAGATIPFAISDIMDTLIAIPARLRGELPPAGSVTVAKTIRSGDGKDEVDRLNYLAGYAMISSQGRAKSVVLMEDQGTTRAPRATFTHKETKAVSMAPGFRTRIDEFFVRYGFVDATGLWKEVRHFDPQALTKVRFPGVDSTQEEDEETAKWIDSKAHAQAVGKRKVDYFWFGLMLWDIEPIYPHPHLEIGDVVAVQTNQFVGRSPQDNREIRGMVVARGTIVEQHGTRGQKFTVWVKSLDDVILSEGDVDITDPRWRDPVPAAVLPELIAERRQENDVAILTLKIRDPQGRLLDLRYKVKSGGGNHDFSDPTDGSWTTAPYTVI